MKIFKGYITELKPNQIFVFGSNYEGRHGGGTARVAVQKFGAIMGQAYGMMGQSYGIVTTDLKTFQRPSVSENFIISQIERLYEFARYNKNLEFFIAYSNDGTPYLSGFTPQEMANMFNRKNIPSNIIFEEGFSKLIQN